MPPASPEPYVVEICEALADTLAVLAGRLDGMPATQADDADGDELSRARQAVTDVRRTLRRLVDVFDCDRVGAIGLRGALLHVLGDLERGAGTYAELRTRGALSRVPGTTADTLLSVARVCALDLQSHARSSVLLLSVRVDDHHVVLDIRDDGVDLVQRHGPGWRRAGRPNLASLARTVERHGGTFLVHACTPRGLSFQAVLPFAAPAGADAHPRSSTR